MKYEYIGKSQKITLPHGYYYIELYGGKGGGENYASFKVQNPIAISNQNPGNGYIIIEKAISRLNSNFYKDSYPQETFDFNKLLEV